MQWLIDIILEAVADAGYITAAFVDRGDPVLNDYHEGNLTCNSQWNDLDLSAIVPAGATAVLLRIVADPTYDEVEAKFRKNGNVQTANISQYIHNYIEVGYAHDLIVAVDTDRKIEYNISSDMDDFQLTIAGWWF